MSSHISTSHFVSAFASRARILRMNQQQGAEWSSKLFRKKQQERLKVDLTEDDVVVRQVRQTTWPEVTRLFNTGLAGFWPLAVFLVVGFAACHITGPSVVMSVVITAITSVMTGLCMSAIITRPNVSCGHPASVVYQLLGEFPSFILSWLDILIHMTLVAACSRAMTATLDKTGDSCFHDFILANFGMTPFVNTFPDFLAGGAVMVTALFIAAGMEESHTLRRWLNIATGCALGFITIIGIWKADADTLKSQPFLLDGSNGVVLSACVLSLVFNGGVQMCHSAKSSSQPHRLVPLANGMSQLAMTLSCLMIAVILPMVAQLSPTGLVPEVPLLQAFENEVGRGWTRLIIATLTIICLCFSLLELSLPLHTMIQQLVKDGLLFSFLGIKFSRTDTPFLGSVILGSVTATVATLSDVSWLLVTGAAAKITFDLIICVSALFVHYGIGLEYIDKKAEQLDDRKKALAKRIVRRRRKKRKADLKTISSAIANTRSLDNCEQPITEANNCEAIDADLMMISSCPSLNSHKTRKAKRGVIVDAAEKKAAKGNIMDKTWTKIRLLFGRHQMLHSAEDEVSDSRIEPADNYDGFSTETETESSPSGYETETSDSSSDTDIDTIVNEYMDEASLPTSMQEFPTKKVAKRGPTKATTHVVKLATWVLMGSFVMQFLIIDNVRSSTMINAVILNLGISVAIFVLLVVISKQPVDRGHGRTDFTFVMPLAPWSHALALFLNISLIARVAHSAWLELAAWICLGCVMYFGYSINHSNLSGTSRGQARRERPNSLKLSPVPISSIPTLDTASGAANFITPTFDMTDMSSNEDRPSIIKDKKGHHQHMRS